MTIIDNKFKIGQEVWLRKHDLCTVVGILPSTQLEILSRKVRFDDYEYDYYMGICYLIEIAYEHYCLAKEEDVFLTKEEAENENQA